ncbi:MAG: NAD-dependent malic enzyme [Pseudomonadota bacterium]
MADKKSPRGIDLLRDPTRNKSTAFTMEEREALGLRGLLPPTVNTQQQQLNRILSNIRRKAYDIERYIALRALQVRSEPLFFKLVVEHIEEIMPLIYTPTVGEACKEFANIFRDSRGLYVSIDDAGDVDKLLGNWPEDDVRVIVVTDGERVLGLGDLGSNGMGISIGKLALYTACAGIRPEQTLPVVLDVGTDTDELREDPVYLGIPRHRVRGEPYEALVDEFIKAVQARYPHALIQFEDFATPNAQLFLERYREQALCFNDDIQGTASVALAGLIASTRVTGIPLSEMRTMFLGHGSAATGIADLMVSSMMDEGLSEEEACSRIRFVGRKGVLVQSSDRKTASTHRFAPDIPEVDFATGMREFEPHALIGATGSPGTFTREIVEQMTALNERPVIFALSNPTSRAECTAEEAYTWSDGKALFASGSPFSPVKHKGKTHWPGQGNNAYIFPGIGLGAVSVQASRVTDVMFLEAARRLANLIKDEDLADGTLYPPLTRIREISLAIAESVAERAFADGLAGIPHPQDLKTFIADQMYDPTY